MWASSILTNGNDVPEIFCWKLLFNQPDLFNSATYRKQDLATSTAAQAYREAKWEKMTSRQPEFTSRFFAKILILPTTATFVSNPLGLQSKKHDRFTCITNSVSEWLLWVNNCAITKQTPMTCADSLSCHWWSLMLPSYERETLLNGWRADHIRSKFNNLIFDVPSVQTIATREDDQMKQVIELISMRATKSIKTAQKLARDEGFNGWLRTWVDSTLLTRNVLSSATTHT